MHNHKYKETLPDFLGIGAQRAGTTWLAKNLRQHPQIWMPPKKEIHYFNRSTSYSSSPSLLTSEFILARIFGGQDHNKRWRNALRKSISRNSRYPVWQAISWDLKFFFGQYNDKWYASLFEGTGDKVTGEITPAYSILETGDIRHIREIMPWVKIIYFVRNPIDRAWSAMRYRVWRESGRRRVKGQPLDSFSLSLGDFEKVFRLREWALRGNYVRTINNWRSSFPEEQFFIGFFDDIVNDPKQLLSEVFEFLGVESSEEYMTLSAFEKINPSPHKEMPLEFRLYLANQYYPQIKTLSEMLGGHADKWRQEVETLLKEAD